ncbi:MAG TPA: hypothetical protein P5072_14760 [Parvularculaceae bacterium]|nr:hypothetical protein [Parvularculaceae bacterium]
MNRLILCAAAAAALFVAPCAFAEEEATAVAAPGPVTIEYYYRIKWGSFDEFMRLYEKNHKPLLDEAEKAGFILSTKTFFPINHMSGDERWDLRVTIEFRDAAAAVSDPAFFALMDETADRLFKDKKKYEDEETKRFSLLDAHWDVIVYAAE